METWALNHHFWNDSPEVANTATIPAIDIPAPQIETTEKAAVYIGIESNIAVIVIGGVNLEGNDFTPFSLSLSISI